MKSCAIANQSVFWRPLWKILLEDALIFLQTRPSGILSNGSMGYSESFYNVFTILHTLSLGYLGSVLCDYVAVPKLYSWRIIRLTVVYWTVLQKLRCIYLRACNCIWDPTSRGNTWLDEFYLITLYCNDLVQRTIGESSYGPIGLKLIAMIHEYYDVSNHRQLDCLLNILFSWTTQKHEWYDWPELYADNPPLTGEFSTHKH